MHTWSLDTVTEVVGKIVHNVQQEGEVSHIVHVNVIRIRSNGPQLKLISIFHTVGARMKSMVITHLLENDFFFLTAVCLPMA